MASALAPDPGAGTAYRLLLSCPAGLPRSRLSVKLHHSFDRIPHPDPALERSIEEIWNQQLRSNPSLFNGTKFRYGGHSLHYIDDSNKEHSVSLHLGLTDYRTFVGTNLNPQWEKFLVPSEDDTVCCQHTSDPLGNAAIVETSDEKIIMLQRSNNVVDFPGYCVFPGGHSEPQEVGISGHQTDDTDIGCLNERVSQEMFDGIIREVVEETGVPADSLTDPVLIGVSRREMNVRPAAFFFIKCNIDSSDVYELYSKAQDGYESTKLYVVSVRTGAPTCQHRTVEREALSPSSLQSNTSPSLRRRRRWPIRMRAAAAAPAPALRHLQPFRRSSRMAASAADPGTAYKLLLTCPEGLPPSRVSVNFDPSFDRIPHPDASLEESISEIWNQRLQQNPSLYSGTKFRYGGHALHCNDESNQKFCLLLHLGLTDYRTFVGTNLNPVWEKFLVPSEDDSVYCQHMSNPLGNGAIVETSDGKIIVLKRSYNVGEFPGYYVFPGGHSEPQEIGILAHQTDEKDVAHINKRVSQEMFDGIIREVVEETGVPASSLTEPVFIGVSRREMNVRPTAFFFTKCNIDSSTVTELYSRAKDGYESTKLYAVSMEELRGISQRMPGCHHGGFALYELMRNAAEKS